MKLNYLGFRKTQHTHECLIGLFVRHPLGNETNEVWLIEFGIGFGRFQFRFQTKQKLVSKETEDRVSFFIRN